MARLIVLCLFLAAIIFFLLPWISISCQGTEIFSASGFDMVRGSYNVPSDIPSDSTSTENEPIAIYALAAAGVGLIVSIFRGGIWRFLRVLAGLAGVGFMIWLKFHLDEQLQGGTQIILQFNYEIGYWLTIGAMALAAVLSIFIKDGAPKQMTPVQTSTPMQVGPPPGGVAPSSPPTPPPPPPPRT